MGEKIKRLTIIFLLVFSIFLNFNFISAEWNESLNDGLVAYYNFSQLNESVFASSDLNLFVNLGSPQLINNASCKSGLGDCGYTPVGANWAIDRNTYFNFNEYFGNITFSYWVKQNGETYSSIMSKSNEDNLNGWDVFTRTDSAGDVSRFLVSDGSLDSNNPFPLGTWHFVAITRNDTATCIWVNGTKINCETPALHGITANNLVIGGTVAYAGNNYLDELGFWNRSLTPSEIIQLYNNGDGITYPITPSPPKNATFENATFNNANVINNLNVNQNISATRGFFNYLGSSISRIVKGWFTEIDAVNIITQNLKVNNKNVCLEDGTNCPADVDTEIKSGSTFVMEGSCTQVIFNANFLSPPIAIGNIENTGENNVVSIKSLSTTGFDLCLNKVKKGGGNFTVYWIATTAGNP